MAETPSKGKGLPPSLPQSRTEILKLDEAWGDAWKHKEMGQKQQQLDKEEKQEHEKVGEKTFPFQSPVLLTLTVPSPLCEALGKQGFGHQTEKT